MDARACVCPSRQSRASRNLMQHTLLIRHTFGISNALKERSWNQRKQKLTKCYISGRGEAWVCVCMLPKKSSLLHRWIQHLLHSKAITALKFDVQPSKWGSCTDVSGKVECAVNTQHQHKAIYCSALRADFCHQCFNQVTSQDICLMALVVFQVHDRYSIQIYRALCWCSVHFSHFIFLYIILTWVKFLLSAYDASCILRKERIKCNFKTKHR